MPEPPRRPCAGGCGSLVERGHCAGCIAKGGGEKGRRTSTQRGYGSRWQKSRAGYLVSHPFCADPFGIHRDGPAPATDLDHIIPHKGCMKRFWDFQRNIQGLCKSCHSRKTAQEGGFGRDWY